LGNPNLSTATAVGTLFALSAFLGASSFTFITCSEDSGSNLLFQAKSRFLERKGNIYPYISASIGTLLTVTAAAEPLAKHRFKNIFKINAKTSALKAPKPPETWLFISGDTVTVILLPPSRITENIIGFFYLNKFFLGLGVVWIMVRMVSASKISVSFFDLVWGSVFPHAKN
jgi:hypothetical protein